MLCGCVSCRVDLLLTDVQTRTKRLLEGKAG